MREVFCRLVGDWGLGGISIVGNIDGSSGVVSSIDEDV